MSPNEFFKKYKHEKKLIHEYKIKLKRKYMIGKFFIYYLLLLYSKRRMQSVAKRGIFCSNIVYKKKPPSELEFSI